jgi:hypothetical protein
MIFLMLLQGTVFYAIDAQVLTNKSDTAGSAVNPILRNAFKQPLQINKALPQRLKPTKYELMNWQNYYLTAEQIRERDRIRNRPLGQQIAEDITANFVRSLLNGGKKPTADIPRF